MFKPKTMLKVVSILFIIFGIFGILGTAVSYIMIPKMGEIPGVDMSVIEAAITPLNLMISIISSISCIAGGIFGISGRSLKGAIISAGVYSVLLLISVVQSALNGTFTFLVVIDFILPALYWWGLYQSE